MALKGPWEFNNPSCAEIGVDLFYRDHDSLESDSTNERNQVKAICKACPCVMDCAEWGITRERWGIWGGMTPKERETIRRRRRRSSITTTHISLLP